MEMKEQVQTLREIAAALSREGSPLTASVLRRIARDVEAACHATVTYTPTRDDVGKVVTIGSGGTACRG